MLVRLLPGLSQGAGSLRGKNNEMNFVPEAGSHAQYICDGNIMEMMGSIPIKEFG